MMDLAAKDVYIQKLASKLFSQREKEPPKRPFVHFKGKSDADPSKKKKKKLKKKDFKEKCTDKTPKPQHKLPPPPAAAQKSPAAGNPTTAQSTKGGNVDRSFSAVDVLRKRLHEKIEESRGQGIPKDPSSEDVLAKRARRKLERERKKRKKKEFLMKKLAEKSGQEEPVEVKKEEPSPPSLPASDKRTKSSIVFNSIETVEEGYETKMQTKMKKKQSVKGNITPLTGRNYKQLLNRVEARKAKLEQLREKDEQKASEMEKKIKWTNLLYKAEGIKIKDNEDMLRASLKRKEKKRSQRKKKWDQRSEKVIEKMQQRQDKRKKNIQKRIHVKMEKKKDRARKKGRILPEDLKKAQV